MTKARFRLSAAPFHGCLKRAKLPFQPVRDLKQVTADFFDSIQM